MCSCQTNLKTYVCKHAVGASIYFGLYIMSDQSKLENLGKRPGRRRKAGPALSRWFSSVYSSFFFSYIHSYYLFLKLNKLLQAQNNG
jgi:hypothetical protein